MKTGLLTLFILITSLKGTSQDINNQWMYNPPPDELYTTHVGYLFEADTLYEISNIGLIQLGKYSLETNILSYTTYDGMSIKYRFSKTTDSLILISNSGIKYKYHARRLEHDANLSFNKITFTGFINRNGFKDISVTIDKSGKANFTGLKEGATKRQRFKVDKKNINRIDSVFKWTCIKSTTYMPTTNNYEHENPFTFKIVYNDSKEAEINGTMFRMPFRIQILHWLILRELRLKKIL